MDFIVYILQSKKDNSYYIGFTSDLIKGWNIIIQENRDIPPERCHGKSFTPKITRLEQRQCAEKDFLKNRETRSFTKDLLKR